MVLPASLIQSGPKTGSAPTAADKAASAKDGTTPSGISKIIGTYRGIPLESVDTFASPVCVASRIASVGQRTSEGLGTKDKSPDRADTPDGGCLPERSSSPKIPIEATTLGVDLRASASSASGFAPLESGKAISSATARVEVLFALTSIAHFVPRTAAMASGVRI